jgi:hypothetical protein
MSKDSTHHNRALQAPVPGIGQADLDAINALHRHPGFAPIEQPPPTEGGKRLWLYKGKVADLNISDPLSAPLSDAYLPINGLTKGWRNNRLVGYLNSVFADVDFHTDPNPRVKAEEAIGRFRVLAAKGDVPYPSIVVRSGRGAWFHYLIREDSSDRSVVRTLATLELWQQLQNRFAYLLTENGFVPDPQARTLSNLIRLPGSLNSSAGGASVLYDVTYRDGGPIAYTMDELARLMHLPAVTVAPVSHWHATAYSPRAPSTGVKMPNRRACRDALIERRERGFWLVVGTTHGGIIKDGDRGAFAFALNSILYGDRDREEKVLKFCKETCRPALTDDRIISLLKGADKLTGRPYLLTDNRGADGRPGIWERLGLGDVGGPVNTYPLDDARDAAGRWNGLNPIEAARHAMRTRLEIDRLRHRAAPKARANKGRAQTQLRRRHEIVRLALAAYMANGKKPTTMRHLAATIRAAGLHVLRRTLRRDLTALGMTWCLTP